MSVDRSEINEFCNHIHFAKNSNFYFISVAKSVIVNAKKTLRILEHEYGPMKGT
jgi:hypothetical protein